MSTGPTRPLRIGVAGLGRAFSLTLPTFVADPRVRLVAAADPRSEARTRFGADFGAPAYDTVEALCGDSSVDVVYVATPHELHAEHAVLAATHGKHVLVEKPMALSLADCTRMIDAAAAAGVQLVVGPSHGFDAPIGRTRALIDAGTFGRVRMIVAFYFTDFLYRPRRPEELDTARGGGAVWNQAAHQVDVARLLGGGSAIGVRALTANWDPARSTEGAYAALLRFADGAFASLAYSGYGHFDGDEFCAGISELGMPKEPACIGSAQRLLATTPGEHAELALKRARNYGGPEFRPPSHALAHEHFGTVIVSCERADLRPLPNGVMIYAAGGARLDPIPAPAIPRREVIDELCAAIASGTPALHDGRWGRANVEVCAAILESTRCGHDIALAHQVALPTQHPPH